MSSRENQIAEIIHRIAVEGFSPKGGESFPGDPALARLRELGSRLWVDTGDAEKARSVWHNDLSALTTNNTLANQVVQTGIMDEAIRETVEALRKSGLNLSQQELITEIGFVINCRIALRLVETFQTHVSVELHPDMSRDIEKSLSYARRYYRINPQHFIVKIPLTPEGYLIVRRLSREGIPINYTLGFSARQNYLAARLSNPEYVNVFLGRLNAVVKDNRIGDGSYVGEKVTVAAQRAVDQVRKEHAVIRTRLIGASIRDGRQVAALAGLDVLTIPPSALQDFLGMNPDPKQIVNCRETDFTPGIDPAALPRFQPLWDVDAPFKKAVESLLQKDLDILRGEDVIACFEAQGISFFHRYTPEEVTAIQKQGKIPRLSDWAEIHPLDDLMTQSALQSFAVDQEALDGRIRKLAG
jgi:transaldolase